jgi:hypothetical protein
MVPSGEGCGGLRGVESSPTLVGHVSVRGTWAVTDFPEKKRRRNHLKHWMTSSLACEGVVKGAGGCEMGVQVSARPLYA